MVTTVDSLPGDIAGSLRHRRIFITGATGFVGRVLVEKLLWSVPDVGKLLLLIRPGRDQSAEERLHGEVLGSTVMDRLRVRHGDDWDAWAASRVEVVPGDLGQDFFGLDSERYAALCGSVNMVVASAATVTFDERLDRALELNTRGAGRTLALARDAGNVPLLHVSTCFVSGTREGVVPERVLPAPPAGQVGSFDLGTTLATLAEACRGISARGDADPPFVAAGLEQARLYGFHDVYTLTKALGELLLVRDQGAVPITIVRPAIVESAVEQPFAGWIDAIRVADPLLVAYGRGRTGEFPGAAGAVLDIVPVDHVVHAMIAAMAESAGLERGTPPPGCTVYQVGSSRNPISLGELVDYAREGFAKTPLRDEHGEPIQVGPVRFVEPAKLLRSLHSRRGRVRALALGLSRLGSLRSTRLGPRLARLGSAERTLDHFIHLLKVYGPYVAHRARHDDEATRGLWSRLAAEDQANFPFDITALRWRSYIAEVHVPGVQRFALHAETGAPPPPRQDDRLARLHAKGEFASDQASTLYDLFATAARMDPDAVAFQTYRGGRWLRYTYGQALTCTSNIAHRLATGYGIAHGDRVVLWGTGSPEWVLTALAVYRLGAVTVPLDPQWPASEVEDAARLTETRLICAAPRLAETLGAASCPVVKLVAPFVPGPHVGLLPGATSAAGAEGDSGGVSSSDLASIIFTSGTTLAPKAVPLTHENFLSNVRAVLQYVPSSRERMLSMLPIHHVFEFVMGLQVPIASLGTISYIAEIKPGEILWMMNATRPTMLVVVPRLLDLFLNGARQKAAAGGPLRALAFRALSALSARTGGRFGRVLLGGVHKGFGGALRRLVGGGSTLEPRLAQSWKDMGFQVTEGYGLTETSPVLTANPWGAVRFGSVGKALPGVEVEVRPTEGAEGGAGEIWVRGPSVMSGYYRNPEASAAALQAGWFCTGDIGRLDADGYLHLSGRTKEIIVTDAGKNVYPEEVEFRYRGIPGVQELVVLSMPASGRGESVYAVVVPQPGATEPQLEQIRSAIAARSADVPSYQQIAQVEFWWADLPKTATLKVKRGKLREALLSGQGSGRPPAAAAPAAKPAAGPGPTPAELWVIATLSRLTHVRADGVGAAHRLAELGLDSLAKVELIGELEARFGRRVDEASVAALSRVQDLFDLVRAG